MIILYLIISKFSKITPKANTTQTAKKKKALRTLNIKEGLVAEVLKEGSGDAATLGNTVTVHYTGWLTTGQQFDSSKSRGPFSFYLGGGKVIDGWDQGVKGMKPGEIRKLTVAPNLGYGARGAGRAIPPNATLIFEIELLSFK
ncbi:MAG: FKBP-type peptidyl-prolyl cis-trans isomerase [Bacteriovoracaceae bacterium]|nr:FKBP-type peptidyl-prolyl cis-trans isomerase [Bacteriovoracaceae bacterium]